DILNRPKQANSTFNLMLPSGEGRRYRASLGACLRGWLFNLHWRPRSPSWQRRIASVEGTSVTAIQAGGGHQRDFGTDQRHRSSESASEKASDEITVLCDGWL